MGNSIVIKPRAIKHDAGHSYRFRLPSAAWVRAESDPGFDTKILFTMFEKLRGSRVDFFARMLDFFDVDRALLQDLLQKMEIKSANFRKGEVDEWRDVLSGEQKNRINRYVPDRLLERFSWNR